MIEIPRVHTFDVELEPGEELWITPLSDLHVEAATLDLDGFTKVMRTRGKHEKHRVILLGDILDLVVPVDLRRWRASVQDAQISGRDDWLNAALDCASERLLNTGCQFDLACPGNHEDEFQKRHGVDTVSMIARDLKCARGGYSGYVQYRINCRGRTQMFRVAYHHGAWGGRVNKGFSGARDWFRGFDGWHVACYGHNHQTTVHREAKYRIGRGGKLVEYPVYYVCTSSWAKTYSDDARTTTYAERAGYMPTTRQTPLIKVTPEETGRAGNARKDIAYTVEI